MIYISFRPLGPWRPFVRTVIFLVKLIVGWMCRWKLVCTCNSYYGPYIPLVPIDVWHLKAWTAERPERWAPEHWATNSALENILRSSLIEWMNGHLRDLLPQYYVRWIPRGLEISPELLLCYSSKLPCILDTLLQWYPIVFLGGRRARRRLWRFGCSSPDAMCGLGPWIQFYCVCLTLCSANPGLTTFRILSVDQDVPQTNESSLPFFLLVHKDAIFVPLDPPPTEGSCRESPDLVSAFNAFHMGARSLPLSVRRDFKIKCI